jgi:hypothetical protein
LSAIYCTPGPDNSILIRTENAVPNNPENNANIKYKVPISFAFEDKNQRSHQSEIAESLLSGVSIKISCVIGVSLFCMLFCVYEFE